MTTYMTIQKWKKLHPELRGWLINHPKPVMKLYDAWQIRVLDSYRIGDSILLVETENELHEWSKIGAGLATTWEKIRWIPKGDEAIIHEAMLRLGAQDDK